MNLYWSVRFYLQRRRQWLQWQWARIKPPCAHCLDVDAMFEKHMRDATGYIIAQGWSVDDVIVPAHMRCGWCRRGPIDTRKQQVAYLSREGSRPCA